MPDPNVSLPAKVVQRGGKHVVVDANGKKLPGTGSFPSAEAAGSVRDRINGAWEEAKSGRRAKGAPAITREARVVARAVSLAVQLSEAFDELREHDLGSRILRWDPAKHPRGRGGKFQISPHEVKAIKRLKTGDLHHVAEGVEIGRNIRGKYTVNTGDIAQQTTHDRPEEALQKAYEHAERIGKMPHWKGPPTDVARKMGAHPYGHGEYRKFISRSHDFNESEDVEESVFSTMREGAMHVKFDPRLHRRDRLGKFAETIGKLKESKPGSTVELPHGVTVRRTVGGLTVSGAGGARRPESDWRLGGEHLDHPHAAAAIALRQHDKAEVEGGADPDTLHHRTLAELEDARRKVMAGGDMTDFYAVENAMKDVRRERGDRMSLGGRPLHGRSQAALDAFRGGRTGTPDEVRQTAKNIDDAFAKVRARRKAVRR